MDKQNLMGKQVKIQIRRKSGYTSDLYNSIQNEIGTITRNPSELSCYNCAYLIKFSVATTSRYAKTHNGSWGGLNADDPDINPMEWWIERKDFIINN